MTTNQITTIARKRILETTGEVISDETILIYANLAQQDIYKKAFPKSQILTASVSLVSGVGTLPALFGTLYGDAYIGTDFYPELSIEDFLKKTLYRCVTIEGGTIKVLPATSGSITIKYYPTFADISSGVNPSINSYFHECIVDGIVYRAQFDLQDESLGTFYKQKYDKDLAEKIAVQSQYEEDNQRSGSMFNEQALISDGANLIDPNHF